jgi:tetratricopeptide (TPR) repeat protein
MNSFNPEIIALIPRVPALLALVFSGMLLFFSFNALSATGTDADTNVHYQRADEIRQKLRYLLAESDGITPQMKELVDEAIRELDKSIQLYPEYVEAYKLQIILYEDMVLRGERDPSRINEVKAIVEQRTLKLAELEPDNPQQQMKLYRLKSRSDPERETIIKTIIESYPDYAPAYRHYARDLNYQGEKQEATKLYQTYVRLQYEQGEVPHPDAIRDLWKLLTGQQRKDEAVDMINRYIDSEKSRTTLVEVIKSLDISEYSDSQYPGFHDKVRQVKNYENYSDLQQANRFLENGERIGSITHPFAPGPVAQFG